VELYNTDGAVGAARAAGVGSGYYKNFSESFRGMEVIKKIEPEKKSVQQTNEVYQSWKKELLKLMKELRNPHPHAFGLTSLKGSN
jgi:xylulokinase